MSNSYRYEEPIKHRWAPPKSFWVILGTSLGLAALVGATGALVRASKMPDKIEPCTESITTASGRLDCNHPMHKLEIVTYQNNGAVKCSCPNRP
jgi:hypothetical protein